MPSVSVAARATRKTTGWATPERMPYQRQRVVGCHRVAVKQATIRAAELTVPTTLWIRPCQVPWSVGTGSDAKPPASARPRPTVCEIATEEAVISNPEMMKFAICTHPPRPISASLTASHTVPAEWCGMGGGYVAGSAGPWQPGVHDVRQREDRRPAEYGQAARDLASRPGAPGLRAVRPERVRPDHDR